MAIYKSLSLSRFHSWWCQASGACGFTFCTAIFMKRCILPSRKTFQSPGNFIWNWKPRCEKKCPAFRLPHMKLSFPCKWNCTGLQKRAWTKKSCRHSFLKYLLFQNKFIFYLTYHRPETIAAIKKLLRPLSRIPGHLPVIFRIFCTS